MTMFSLPPQTVSFLEGVEEVELKWVFAVLVNSGCTGISCLNSLIFPSLSLFFFFISPLLPPSLLCSLSLLSSLSLFSAAANILV